MTPTSHRGDGRRCVLDANALIAVLEGRPRSVSKVRHPIEEAIRREVPLAMSAVNWAKFSPSFGNGMGSSRRGKPTLACKNFPW
jgi:hypothetical protein